MRQINYWIYTQQGLEKWMFYCFYVHLEMEKRLRVGIQCTIFMVQIHTCDYLLVILNEIMYQSKESSGAKRSARQMAAFQDALTNCSLSDLGYYSRKYI